MINGTVKLPTRGGSGKQFDGMSEKEFVASITLLGAHEGINPRNFIITRTISKHHHISVLIELSGLYLIYDKVTYTLGNYKQCLLKIVKDLTRVNK